MYQFFSEFGDIVDLNLEYFPEMIIVTYTKHSDVLKIIDKKEFAYSKVDQGHWIFRADKIDFVLPVRNCQYSKAGVAMKFMPQFLQKEIIQGQKVGQQRY